MSIGTLNVVTEGWVRGYSATPRQFLLQIPAHSTTIILTCQ